LAKADAGGGEATRRVRRPASREFRTMNVATLKPRRATATVRRRAGPCSTRGSLCAEQVSKIQISCLGGLSFASAVWKPVVRAGGTAAAGPRRRWREQGSRCFAPHENLDSAVTSIAPPHSLYSLAPCSTRRVLATGSEAGAFCTGSHVAEFGPFASSSQPVIESERENVAQPSRNLCIRC